MLYVALPTKIRSGWECQTHQLTSITERKGFKRQAQELYIFTFNLVQLSTGTVAVKSDLWVSYLFVLGFYYERTDIKAD